MGLFGTSILKKCGTGTYRLLTLKTILERFHDHGITEIAKQNTKVCLRFQLFLGGFSI